MSAELLERKITPLANKRKRSGKEQFWLIFRYASLTFIWFLIVMPIYVLVVNSLKGVSSRLLRKERPDIEKKYWNGGLWSASYFVGSVGGAPIEVLKKYIESQAAP